MSLHRRAARKDDNHAAVVEVLRNSGCSVQPLNAPGAPDLVVGLNGTNHLVEVKRPLGAKGGRSHRDLNPLQRAWHGAWRGEPQTLGLPSAPPVPAANALASCSRPRASSP